MSTFAEGLRDGLRRAYCSQVRQSPTWFSNLREVLVSGDLLRRGDALNRWICGTDPEEPSPVEPPFQGGQCDAVYLVDIRVTSTSFAGGSAVFRRRVRGPIGGVRINVSPLAGAAQIFSSSEPLSTTVCGNRPKLSPAWRNIGVGGADLLPENGGAIAIEAITPCGADNCGDPPLDLPPPGPVEVPVNITYEGDNNQNFNLTVPTIFAPVYVALDGTLRIPIRIGELNFNGEVNLDNNFEIKPNFGTDGGPGDTDGTEPPNDPDPTDPVEPPSEESPATIIGVEVFSQVSPSAPASSIIFDNAPNIFAPRLGSVSFAIRTPSSLVWTADIDVKNVETYIPCPAPQGAVAVRATPAPGVTVRWNAIRSKPLLQI